MSFQQDSFQNDAFDVQSSGPTEYPHSDNASLSFTSAMAKQVGRSLAGALSFTSAMTRRTAKTPAASLSFTGALQAQVLTPALVAVHIHTE